MMDANGNCNHDKTLDKDLAKFVEVATLADPFHKLFPGQVNTYLYSSKHIDYILINPALVNAEEHIRYFSTQEGSLLDRITA